jgi:hypothetical protein
MEPWRPVSNHTSPQAEDQTDHHCPAHATFTAACESCVRARAAFLPYPSASTPHPAHPHSSRSFGFTDQMSEMEIQSLAHPIREELRQQATRYLEREATNEIIDDLLRKSS